MHLALIGKGRWGTNIAKTLESFPDVRLTIVPRGEQAPNEIDGVLIATPSDTHAAIALPYIEKGIPTFIEKPLTTSSTDAKKIVNAAHKSQALVFVGHIYTHNPAFETVRKLLPTLGKMLYVISEKMNFGPREGESVFWDWMPHDVSMGITLFDKPTAVTASGARVGGGYDAAIVSVRYGDIPFLSLIHWRSPEKKKITTFVGQKGTLVFDDGADRKLTLYAADIVSHPEYSDALPLTRELRSFIDAITNGSTSESLELGSHVVATIEAIERSAFDGKEHTLKA